MNTMNPSAAHRSPRRNAFTLTELLVVIGIMMLLMAVGIPATKTLFGSGQAESAINAISAAVSAARTYAGLNPTFDIGSYSGVAIIFDSSNQMRLTRNVDKDPNKPGTDKMLRDETNKELELPDGFGNFGRYPVNGYIDLPRDYLSIPAGVGVVGIVRGPKGNSATGDNLKLLAPPFAVRFNEYGTLVPGTASNPKRSGGSPEVENIVIYDGNYDDKYITGTGEGSDRTKPYGGGTYDPLKWDPESETFDLRMTLTGLGSRTNSRAKVPFERLEAVIGVIVYDKKSLTEELKGEMVKGDLAYEWLRTNGTPLFFNRYTGTVVTP